VLKHAFADRAEFLGDTDFVKVPVTRLLSDRYAARMASQIKLDSVLEPASYGRFFLNDDAGTSHFSVIDADGNAVACTETINLAFGSFVVEPAYGILLNNEIDDFAAQPGKPNAFGLLQSASNAIEPGKRPLSSMTPTIVIENGRAVISAGASGGPRIITATLQNLLNQMLFRMPPSEAVAAPRFHHQWSPNELLLEKALHETAAADLAKTGHQLRLSGGLAATQAAATATSTAGLLGGSDPVNMDVPTDTDRAMQPPPIPIVYKLRTLLGKPLRRRLTAARTRFLDSAHSNCRENQRAVLRDLLQLNADTGFARHHQLHPQMSLSEFRSRIPVADYELFRPWIDRVADGDHSALLGPNNRLLMFALTSGTTHSSKRIPVTSRFLHDYRRGWQQWGVGVYKHFPKLPDLNIVQISSSHRRSFTSGGTPCGNISGLVASMQNAVVRSLYTISADVAEVDQQQLKRRFTLMLALADPYVGVFMTANPATLMQLFNEIDTAPEQLIRDLHDGLRSQIPADCPTADSLRRKLGPKPARAAQLAEILKRRGKLTPREIWPCLQVLGVWTGGSAAAFRQDLKQICEDIPVWDHGLHASEGRMTLPLEPGQSTGLLEIQTHFFEFLPVREEGSPNPVVLEAHELEVGSEYYILLTTSSGLCRYHIRDVVRCTGFHGATPLLEFLHKGAHISSITGEKISESQVVQAAAQSR
jgi:hypothetical protein